MYDCFICSTVIKQCYFLFYDLRILMENTEEHMQYVLRFWDASLDMNRDLQEQVEALPQVVSNEKARFTIIGLDGTVYADSEVEDISSMYDHSDRDEVQEALEGEDGVAVRRSDTLDISMLYVTLFTESSVNTASGNPIYWFRSLC